MQQNINANILAQVVNNEIEAQDLVDILKTMYNEIPCEELEDEEYNKLIAANCLSKANKNLYETFRKRIIDLLKGPKGNESVTVNVGTRMVKLYYNTAYTWQNYRAEKKKEEEKTEKDRLIETELAVFKELAAQLVEAEVRVSTLKAKKKASEETLAALLPDSKCIHYSPVLQVVEM